MIQLDDLVIVVTDHYGPNRVGPLKRTVGHVVGTEPSLDLVLIRPINCFVYWRGAEELGRQVPNNLGVIASAPPELRRIFESCYDPGEARSL